MVKLIPKQPEVITEFEKMRKGPKSSKMRGNYAVGIGVVIPYEYKHDVVDAIDTWLKAYKTKFNDKTNRQRNRMKKIIEIIGVS